MSAAIPDSESDLPAPLLQSLRRAGWVGDSPSVRPLTGGVSCEIWRVEDSGRIFVVKRALPQLKVATEWYADVARNRYEQDYLRYVGDFLPEAVPKILFSEPEENFFAMEYLPFGDWKKDLLAGRIDAAVAGRAGSTLGRIHAQSWGDADVARRFETGNHFHELRVAPYLLATAKAHPDLAAWIEQEADRLAHTHRALVHGDFSPKNLLVAPTRLIVLDCEVAWYGDPAFDVTFLLSHLLLKSLHHPQDAERLFGLVDSFLAAYGKALGEEHFAVVEADCRQLLLCLLLARVDGQSPVEYLQEQQQKDFVRHFVRRQRQNPHQELAQSLSLWRDSLPT